MAEREMMGDNQNILYTGIEVSSYKTLSLRGCSPCHFCLFVFIWFYYFGLKDSLEVWSGIHQLVQAD